MSRVYRFKGYFPGNLEADRFQVIWIMDQAGRALLALIPDSSCARYDKKTDETGTDHFAISQAEFLFPLYRDQGERLHAEAFIPGKGRVEASRWRLSDETTYEEVSRGWR